MIERMFVDVEDRELQRLIAAAPDWPTLDELGELAPPVPPDDDWSDGVQPGAPAPFDVVPSGWLAVDLDASTADPRVLSDAQLVDAMAGFGRVATWAQARQSRVVAELDRRRPASASRYTPDEVALALSMSRFSATGLLERSRRLVEVLHDTLAAFEAGTVDGFKVRLICDAVRYLDDAQAEWVQHQVLDRAPQQSVAQLRAALARAVIAVDAEGANARHHRARKDRRVGVGQEQDGMATVWASLAAQDAQQVFGTLTGLARSLGADDPRGMDARRADLLVGLMTGEISIAFPTPDSPTPDEVHRPTTAATGTDTTGTTGTDTTGTDTTGNGGGDGGDGDGGDSGGDGHSGDDGYGGDSVGGPGGETDSGPAGPPTGGGITRSDTSRSDTSRSDTSRSDTTRGSGVGGSDEVRDAATATGRTTGSRPVCPVCVAQAWRASRPQVRPVNPTKPLVQVLIAHSTLRGTDHAPAELVAYGAICADQAREIASDALWRRLVYDDLTGALLDHGRRTYRPPTALADHVRARDVHCRSPLCRRRAIDCELDHTIAFPHGPTAEPNLAAVCLIHHDEKHAPGWTVLQHPDGHIDWTTPTGHVHSSHVHDYRPPPPPPPPSVPGPIADHTDTQPTPPAPPARGLRGRYDWTDTGDPDGDRDPPPF
jgi:hypothetical protein